MNSKEQSESVPLPQNLTSWEAVKGYVACCFRENRGSALCELDRLVSHPPETLVEQWVQSMICNLRARPFPGGLKPLQFSNEPIDSGLKAYALADLIRKARLLQAEEPEGFLPMLQKIKEASTRVLENPQVVAEDRAWAEYALDALSGKPSLIECIPGPGFIEPLTWLQANGVATNEPFVESDAVSNPLPVLPKDQPRVSILMAVRNCAEYLPQTLASVQRQSWDNWELLVNDGQSTDHTREVVEQWAAGDPRIKLQRQQNKGLAGARNEALQKARGKYVHCLDGDDLIHPDFYRFMVSALETDESDGFRCAVASAKKFSGFSRVFLDSPVPKADRLTFPGLVKSCTIPCHSVVFERSILEKTGAFDEEIYTCEDWDLWLRFARIGVNFIRVPDAWCWYRIVDTGSLSRQYTPYNNAVSELLMRTCKLDSRCRIPDVADAPVEEQQAWNAVAGFWLENVRRAATMLDAAAITELYAWSRGKLPDNFWGHPLDYLPTFKFRAVDELTAGSRLKQLVLYTNGLLAGWKGPPPNDVLHDLYQSVLYEKLHGAGGRGMTGLCRHWRKLGAKRTFVLLFYSLRGG